MRFVVWFEFGGFFMRVLIAGGGTGGHIYPAISIARALLEIDSKICVEFVGTPQGLETRLIPAAGFQIHTISVGRLNRNVGLKEQIKTLFFLPVAIIKSFLLVRQFAPDCVLGVGGYASGPLVFAAAVMNYRTYIWEPNAYPGLANRILSRFVKHALVVFEEAARHLNCRKITRVHMPVRKEIEESGLLPKIKSLTATGPFRILVFGGSQGSRAINNCLVEAVRRGGDWLDGVEIVHQTGSIDYARIRDEYALIKNNQVQVLEYLNDMPARYTWSHLVICRAGTGTISELAASAKAAVLIPYPQAADDHQTKNAQALVDIGAAEILPQASLSPESLTALIKSLKGNAEKILQLEQNIKKFHKPNAAYEIAKTMISECNRGRL